jgi:DHA1 family bicyclomycin/chloramphenicol resistance-like MFS transporter
MADNALLLRRLLPALIIGSMIGPLALNIVMPSMPGWTTWFNASRAEVQLTLSLFLASQAVSQLFIGPLADRYGRRPVLLCSLGLFVAASIAASFATSIEILIAARVVQAAGGTAGLALGRTIVRDLAPMDTAASMIGYVTMGMVVAPLLAPTIGGLIDERMGWHAIFWVCASLGLVSLTLNLTMLPETRPREYVGQSGGEVLRRSAGLLGNRKVMGYALGCGFTSAVFFTFIGAAPYLVVEVLKLPKTAYGPWFMVLSFGYMIGNFCSGRFSERLGVDRMIQIGCLISLAGVLVLLALAAVPVLHPAALFLPCFVTSLGNGMFLPNAIAGAVSVDPRASGAASGLTGSTQMGFGALFSFIAGEVTKASPLPMAAIMTTLTLAAWASIAWGKRN